ncbi:MAG: hypothetical protein ACYDAG_02135 [Chloroflexota bacterium]
MRDDYIAVESEGVRFRFYLDRHQRSALHIHARHGLGIQDALDLFFDTEARWNERHKRFENQGGNRVLYWAWKQPNSEVVIITCFEKE